MAQGDFERRSKSSKNTLFCSFCGKSQHDVSKLIAGPTVFICDGCVEVCDDVIIDSLYPGRSVVRIKVSSAHVLDDSLYPSLSELFETKYASLNLKYEFKSVTRSDDGKRLNSIVLFSYDEIYGNIDGSSKKYEELNSELEDAILKISVLNEKFLHESEKVRLLAKELDELRVEYLDFLRKNIGVSGGKNELASVVFIDVRGFSKFSYDEKKRVLDLLRGIVPVVLSSNGANNVNMWGDGVVAIFQDAGTSIECAVKFIRHLAVEHLEARIGMSWGRVRVAFNAAIGREDIDGAVVDLAARLEPLADPGQIVLSKEFAALEINPSVGELIPVKLPVKKAFSNYNEGDLIEVYKLNIIKN